MAITINSKFVKFNYVKHRTVEGQEGSQPYVREDIAEILDAIVNYGSIAFIYGYDNKLPWPDGNATEYIPDDPQILSGNVIFAQGKWFGTSKASLEDALGDSKIIEKLESVLNIGTLQGKVSTLESTVGKKVDKTDIIQSTGTSETAVMSQNAVSDALNTKVDKTELDSYATKEYVQTNAPNETKESIEEKLGAWLEDDGGESDGEVYTKTESDARYYEKSATDTLLADKVSKSDIVQSTGTSETAVMSQKVVSDIVDELERKVTNAADGEDITVIEENGTSKLRFADRNYEPLNASGKGYKILRKNIQTIDGERKNVLTQDMINEPNTIYEIRYDFDLNGAEITVPENCILKFNGGSLSNGTINNGIIDCSGNNKIFTNINFNKLYSLQDVRPEWFGAKGDGIADDTEAIRIAFFVCNYKNADGDRDGCRLLCNPKKYYKISGNINNFNGDDYDLFLNCVGNIPIGTTPYDHDNNVTFFLTNGASMFKNANIYGSLSNCKIVTQDYKANNTYIFNNCKCNNLNFSYNTIDRVESFLYNTGVHQITKIHDNRIVSEYFAKVDKTNSGLVDSFIYNNYISGDVGRTDNIDNYCFGWYVYNGSIIKNNFIDYFNCIYSPQQESSQVVLSIGNQYQVFRYFYTAGFYKDLELKIHTYGISINSIGDSFNWLDPNSLPFLKLLKPYYTNTSQLQISTNSVVNNTKEVPPYIACFVGYSICIKNAQIEGNIKEFIYDRVPTNSIKNYKLNVDYIRNPSFSNANDFYIEKSDSYYPYYNNMDVIKDFYISGYDTLDALPEIKNFGLWCNYPLSYKVKVGQNIYKLILKRFTNRNVVKFEWEPINSIIIEDKSFGDYQSRPTNVEIGSSYFCTDRQTSEGASNGIMIYYKGNNIWVDALGRAVV